MNMKMKKTIEILMGAWSWGAMLLIAGAINFANAEDSATEEGQALNVHSYTMADIDGTDVELSKYDGKVMLIVNVASKCGLTPQYADLVKLHDQFSGQGLAILGFPANNFLRQEPGTEAEIKEFCTSEFGVEFDMYSKISVKGDDIHPFYADLTSNEKNGEFGGEIRWNFNKFLVDRHGNVIARFEPKVKPSDAEVVAAIEGALGAE